MQVHMELVYLVTGVIVVATSPLAAAPGNKRVKRSHMGTSHHNNGQFFSLCPRVECPRIPTRCKDVEVIVLEYSFYNNFGRKVDVRCESCSYCMDFSSIRYRRDLSDLLLSPSSARSHRAAARHRQRHAQSCSTLECPAIDDTCESVMMTNVLLNEEHCKECPACFDNTIIHSLD